MRILFWTDGFIPRIGGIETQGLQFIQALQERGHQCLVLTHQDKPGWKEDEIHEGIQIKRFCFNKMILDKDLKKFRRIQDYLEWVLENFRPEIIHLNTVVGGSLFAFLLFKERFQIPAVLTVHAPLSEINPVVRQTFSSIDRACCVSNWVLTEMKKHLPEGKFQVIYNGLKWPKITPQPLPFEPSTLLVLGRLSLEKGYDTAIKAFSLLKKRGRLLIAGEGFERPALEKLVCELNLSESVQFIGQIELERAPSLINESTLVLIPSHSESFGLVALEAMQMGRPVIASNVGGLLEILQEGKTALFVPPQDPVALSLAIESLLENPQKARELGMNGRKWAEKNFTLLQNVTQYETLYQELLQ
jgi:glycosyltransferase involved in cell wall biosynthesis